MTLQEVSASMQIGFPILSLLIGLPLLGMALVAALPGRVGWYVAIAVSAAELLLALVMISAFKTGSGDLQFVEHGPSIYHLGVDGISALFVPLTALLTLLACLSSESAQGDDSRSYLASVLGLCAVLVGAFAAADVMLLWLFCSLELVPGWLLVARYGTGSERRSVARHYTAMMVVSSAMLFVGLELLLSETGGASDFKSLAAAVVPTSAQASIFLLLAVAIAIKAPVFPFHGWLPRVLEHGPVVGLGVFLVGIKLGLYLLLRIVVPLLPEALVTYHDVVVGFAIFGMVYGGLIALSQTDMRRLLAYASVSHVGVVILGVMSMNVYGLQGGYLQALSIGLAIAGLYFVAGFVHQRLGHTDSTRMGGLVQRTPLLAGAFLITAMAAVGLPGTSGFNGEHLIIIGAYKSHWGLALTAGLGTLLAAAYYLRYFQNAFLADSSDPARAAVPDLGGRERVITVAMVGLVLAVGLYTSPVLSVAGGSLAQMGRLVEERVGLQAKGALPTAIAPVSLPAADATPRNP